MSAIDSFHGEHRFLSNFYPSEVSMYGHLYSTIEHAFQAAKTFDMAQRYGIRMAETPGQAKRLGRSVTLRADWETVKIEVMETLLFRKFRGSKVLRDKLLATGTRELIEGNTWGDKYWGVCDGEGRNELGKALMRVRDELRKEE